MCALVSFARKNHGEGAEGPDRRCTRSGFYLLRSTDPQDSTAFFFFLDFIYLFLERGEGREKERERNIDVQEELGTWPAMEACALTQNQTGHLPVCGAMSNPLSHTSQGGFALFAVPGLGPELRECSHTW